jgi:hypothetical protein
MSAPRFHRASRAARQAKKDAPKWTSPLDAEDRATIPRIVSAAVRARFRDPYGNMVELILSAPPPARHHHIMHPLALSAMKLVVGPEDQGFLDSEGTFRERAQAYTMAMDNGQLDGKVIDHGRQLFSEDLW